MSKFRQLLTPDFYFEARHWLRQCTEAGITFNNYVDLVDDLSDNEVANLVDKHFDGGCRGFAQSYVEVDA